MPSHTRCRPARSNYRSEGGYTLIELMVAVAVMMIVSAGVFNGARQLTTMGETINNRTEMHAGVRNATELLQQEVGQAGRIALPGTVTLNVAVVADADNPQTVAVASTAPTPTAGIFVGEKVKVGAGPTEETVTLTNVNPGAGTITGIFTVNHAAGAAVTVQGSFSAGIVPTNTLNGSTGTALKMFGDINGDGNMVYIEYVCDVATGNLYRNSMPFDALNKLPPTVAQVLLNNILPNPGNTPCFTYQQRTVVGTTYVTDVAITLTVQTQRRDPVTGLFQTETKALLNVSPRNVYQVWQMATVNVTSRVQPMPPSVGGLLYTAQAQ